MNRICREVRAQLPGFVVGTLPAWRRRLVQWHLRRCDGCQAELEHQRRIAADLRDLGAAVVAATADPPDGLLDRLLEQTARPGVRGRVAVPARGAVSGARPALSVALLIAGAVAGTAVGYASWRGARAVSDRLGRRRTRDGS